METHISSFPMVDLSKYAEIKPGFAFKSDRFTETPSDVPLVKGDNVQQGYIDWAKAKFWNREDIDDYRDYLLHPGDIVVAMDRPWVNAGLKWAFIKPHDPKCLLVQRVARLRAKKGLSQGFLRYLVSSEYFASYIEPIVTGVNIPHISGKQIGDFRIPLPGIEVQEKIAALLATYDDLIENNKRRIALLENMAQEIYREWFVRFRFPGWQGAEFEKGTPKSWTDNTLGNLCSVIKRGISPTYSEEEQCDLVLNQKCIRAGKINLSLARQHKTEIQDEKNIQYADALVNSTGVGTLGRVSIVEFSPKRLTVDSHITICRADPKKINIIYLAATIAQLQSHFELLASGSTGQVELNRSLISSIKVLIPNAWITERFAKFIEPIWQQKHMLLQQIEALESTKTQLLPRLISGKLSVENLDIEFPPSMHNDQSDRADEAAA